MLLETEMRPSYRRFTAPEQVVVDNIDNNDLTRACVLDACSRKELPPERQIALVEYIKEGWRAKEEFDRNGASPQKKATLNFLIERGRESRGELMETNFRLIVNRAQKYQSRGVDFLDLVHEGFLKFDDAIKGFEPRKGYKFSTYLTWWIDQGIERAIYTHGRTIRWPERLATNIYKIKKTESSLRQTLERDPTDQEVMDASKMTKRVYENAKKAQSETIVTLDAAEGEEYLSSNVRSRSHKTRRHFIMSRPTEDAALANIIREKYTNL